MKRGDAGDKWELSQRKDRPPLCPPHFPPLFRVKTGFWLHPFSVLTELHNRAATRKAAEPSPLGDGGLLF